MSDEHAPVLLPGGGWRLGRSSRCAAPAFPPTACCTWPRPQLAEAADRARTDPSLPERARDAAAAAVDTARHLAAAAQPRFQAALAWQNPAVLRTGIAPFLRWTPGVDSRSSMPRQREELVAHYWQRFCVKNDTIGFFGPVGWGRWDLSAPHAVAVDAGRGFLAAQEVYFSGWAVDALAKVLAEDEELMRWIPPRRMSFVHCQDGTVRFLGRPAQPVGELQQAVLLRCDGTRHLTAVAADLGLESDDVAGIVRELAGRRWVQWRLEVPAATHPDRALRTSWNAYPTRPSATGHWRNSPCWSAAATPYGTPGPTPPR
ncbi:lantibiotic dehydratase [Streptomyces hirsutus]